MKFYKSITDTYSCFGKGKIFEGNAEEGWIMFDTKHGGRKYFLGFNAKMQHSFEEVVPEVKSKGKIYIAGPMRSYYAFNFKAFFKAQVMLEEAGWEVANPAEIDVEEILCGAYKARCAVKFNGKDVLLRDMKELLCRGATAIYMMEGFNDSDGARGEWYISRAVGLKIYYQSIVDEQKYGREGEGGSVEG